MLVDEVSGLLGRRERLVLELESVVEVARVLLESIGLVVKE